MIRRTLFQPHNRPDLLGAVARTHPWRLGLNGLGALLVSLPLVFTLGAGNVFAVLGSDSTYGYLALLMASAGLLLSVMMALGGGLAAAAFVLAALSSDALSLALFHWHGLLDGRGGTLLAAGALAGARLAWFVTIALAAERIQAARSQSLLK